MSFPVGTVLTLDLPALDDDAAFEAGLPTGSADPWSRIRVNAHIDHGPDRGGVENIVAPIEFSAWSSPKVVSDDSLDAIGYVVETEGPEATPWETSAAELDPSAPKSAKVPQYGQPGWARFDRLRQQAAKEQA